MLNAARARLPQQTWAQRALQRLMPHAPRLTHLLCADMERLPAGGQQREPHLVQLALQWAQ